ncbi:hypothetical protein ACTXT7_009707 [Hymenolepis weldensis]
MAIQKPLNFKAEISHVSSSTPLVKTAPVFVLNNCQVVRTDVHPSIDEEDDRLRDNLREFFVLRLNKNSADLRFVTSSLAKNYENNLIVRTKAAGHDMPRDKR